MILGLFRIMVIPNCLIAKDLNFIRMRVYEIESIVILNTSHTCIDYLTIIIIFYLFVLQSILSTRQSRHNRLNNISVGSGIYQNSVYGMAAKLPSKYTGMVILGSVSKSWIKRCYYFPLSALQ